MACRTCDHTMQRVNEGVNPKVFWCPRCGTLKMEPGVPKFEEPKIVQRAFFLWEAAADAWRMIEPQGEGATVRERLAVAMLSVRESWPVARCGKR